jgi:hypothetical protein
MMAWPVPRFNRRLRRRAISDFDFPAVSVPVSEIYYLKIARPVTGVYAVA